MLRRLRYGLFISGLLLTLLTACSKSTVTVVQPKQGDLHQQFVELAETHIDHPILLTMPFSGELAAHLQSIKFKPGDAVKKGQLLTELKQKPLILALKHTEAVLQMASKHVVAARHQVSVAAKDYQHQQKSLKRYQYLLKSKSISAEKFDQVRLAAQQSEDILNQFEASLYVFIAKQKAARVNTEILQHRLDTSQLRSPITGTILHVHHQGGAWVNAGEPIVSLGDMHKMNIVSSVLSHRAHQLHIGDLVELGLSRTNFPFSGKITRIYPLGFLERSPLGVKEQRVSLIIVPKKLKSMPQSLGSRIYARFTLASYRGLILPRSAVLRTKTGAYYVYKLKAGRLQRQAVTIGIDGGADLAILSGLKQQDRVVEYPRHEMHAGQHVAVVESAN